MALQVRGLHRGGAYGHVVGPFFFRQRFEGFEFFTGLGCLQLADLLAQHRLCLERVLLEVCDQLLLFVDDLLELVHPLVVALLLVSALVVPVVDRFDVRVDFLDLIKRRSSIERSGCIINHLSESTS